MECEEREWCSWNENGMAEGPVPNLNSLWFCFWFLLPHLEIRRNSSPVPGSCLDGPVRKLASFLEFLPVLWFFLQLDQQSPSQAEQSLCWMCWECSGTGWRQCPRWWLWRGGGSSFWGPFPSVPYLLVCCGGSVLQLTGCIFRSGCISDWLQDI